MLLFIFLYFVYSTWAPSSVTPQFSCCFPGGHFWFPLSSRAKVREDGQVQLLKCGSWATSAGFADFYVIQTTSPDFKGDFSNLSVFLLDKVCLTVYLGIVDFAVKMWCIFVFCGASMCFCGASLSFVVRSCVSVVRLCLLWCVHLFLWCVHVFLWCVFVFCGAFLCFCVRLCLLWCVHVFCGVSLSFVVRPCVLWCVFVFCGASVCFCGASLSFVVRPCVSVVRLLWCVHVFL